MEMKTCNTCNEEKDITSFWKSLNNGEEGIRNSCIDCMKKASLIYRKNNKNKIRDVGIEYRKRKGAGLKEKKKEYYHKNKERNRSKNRAYYQAHKKQVAEYLAKRRVTNPNFKLKEGLSNRINRAIKCGYGEKAYKTIILLGCTIDELRIHLEAQFTEGMTWNNHTTDGWHIDHIRPCYSFNLVDPEQQKLCFHYTNLQPLWWRDNIVKGNKFKKNKKEKEIDN